MEDRGALVIEIDGSLHSGSGTIVRQCAAYAGLTGQAVHLVRARERRPHPGLRPQHLRAIEAVRELVDGTLEGATVGSREFTLTPGRPPAGGDYRWDIGSAGSTTALISALLPLLAFASHAVRIEVLGGLFQDNAPSFFHLLHVLGPLAERMGVHPRFEMLRPGYVPRGEGILLVEVAPTTVPLRPLQLVRPESPARVWAIALASHLLERRVSARMVEAAREVLATHDLSLDAETREDEAAVQAGAALALFADFDGGIRLGADRAGAPRRSSEAIGRYAARQLLEDIRSGAALDRFAADQLIPFAALAAGETRVRIPRVTEHIDSGAWLAKEFTGAEVRLDDGAMTVQGVGLRPAVGPGGIPAPS